MLRSWKAWLALLLVSSFLGGVGPRVSQAYADEIPTFVIQKQTEKEKVRWSLADWLDTRDRMRMQDLWLALHSPAPYEFYLGGNYQFNQSPTSSSFSAWETYFAAFVTIFGLEARYESTVDTRWSGIFHLRIFGYHDQSTNITLQLGLRNEQNSATSFRNPLAGISMTLYLMRHFGIDLLYRHYFYSTPDSSGVSYFGDRYQGGAFLDFSFLRIYGEYFSEVGTLPNIKGVQIGTKIYF